MKNIFAFVLISLIFTSASGQETKNTNEFTVTVGKPYPVIDALKSYYTNNGNAISIKNYKGKYQIQKYDTKEATVASTALYEDLPKKHKVLGEIALKDKLYLVYFVEEKEKGITVFTRELSFVTGKFMDDGKVLTEIQDELEESRGFSPVIIIGRDNSYNYNEKINIKTAVDGQHFYLRYTLKKDKRSDPDKFKYLVFDQNLLKKWEKEIVFQAEYPYMRFLSQEIDKKARVFLLTQIFDNKNYDEYDRDGKPRFKTKIFTIDASGLKENKNEIDFDDKLLSQMEIYSDPDANLILTGIYSKKTTKNRSFIDGYFVLKLNEEGSITDKKNFEIPNDIIKENLSQRTKEKLEKEEEKNSDIGLTNLYLRDITFHDDGSIVFVGERYYVRSHTDSKGNTTYSYHYEDMYISKVGPKNELIWIKKIPKRQRGGSPGGDLGCKYISCGDDHIVLFLDNVKNLNLTSDQIPETHSSGRGGYLTAYKIADKDGSFEKLSLVDLRNADGVELYDFKIGRIMEVSDKTILLEFYKKAKEDVLLKIDFK